MKTNQTNQETQTTGRNLRRATLSLGSRLVIGGALLSVLCGCQVLTYTSPTGESFTRSSLGSTTAIAALRVETGTNGLRRIELRGYQNDSTQALGIVTEAAVRGALQCVNPLP